MKVDGLDKVTGNSQFGADLMLPGMLYGKILRSPYAHARIKTHKHQQSRHEARSYGRGHRGRLSELGPRYSGLCWASALSKCRI